MKIFVRPKHIKTGVRDSCHKCPIALAVLEQTGAKYVFVDAWVELSTVKVPLCNESVSASLPKKALKFIKAFDEKRPVKPFSFILPNAVLKKYATL